MNYRYSLAGKKKHTCPNCGKRTFVKYIDNRTGQYLADHIGKCDRADKCGCWNKPEKNQRATISDNPLPNGICLNVNIPSFPESEIKGIRICRQAKGNWKEEFEKRKDPMGKTYYWLTGMFQNQEPEAVDTDEWALANGYVSVVPVSVDMTAHWFISNLKEQYSE